MKHLRNHIINHPHYNKVKHWGKLIFITGSAQVIVQVIGLVSGILVIRLLPVEEYALYTLANTMLGTMTVLSDGGISNGVMALGGKVWEDKTKLGVVVSTGLDLRRKFAIGALAVSVPILCYLLMHHGASWITTILIAASLIPAFYAALSDNLLQIAPKLHQAITPLQKNQINVSIGRLLLTGLTLFAFPWAFVAILASGIPRIWGNFKLRKISNNFADHEQLPGVEERKELLKTVKRILPSAIYFAFSGQITIWLISIFGETTSIAQIGALGRLAVIFTLATSIVQMLIIPRFSRLQNERRLIIKNFVRVELLLFVVAIIMVLIAKIFSNQFLWVLGIDYFGLNKELLFIMISGSINFVGMCTNGLLMARNIVMSPIIYLPLIIFIQIIILFFVPLNNIIGVTSYAIISTFIIYMIRLIYFIIQMKRI